MNKEQKWQPHSILSIAIEYAKNVHPIHDANQKLFVEVLELKVERMDYEYFGLPQRLWRVLINPEHGEMQEGERQLHALSNEGLEVLRNSLGNLHSQATRILNERGSGRYGHHFAPETLQGLQKGRSPALPGSGRPKRLSPGKGPI